MPVPISQEQFAHIAKDLPGMGNHPQAIRMRVEALEKVLERAFHIPGTKIPVGLDTVIGLVPVLGDLVTAAMGAYIVWEGRNLGMSKWQLLRMSANPGYSWQLNWQPTCGRVILSASTWKLSITA
jgi:hypothetical protein